MAKNTIILERRNLKDEQGYMALIHDLDVKESYWVKYDSKGYDENGYDAQGYNTQGYDAHGFDTQGLNAHGFDRYGVQTGAPVVGISSASDDEA